MWVATRCAGRHRLTAGLSPAACKPDRKMAGARCRDRLISAAGHAELLTQTRAMAGRAMLIPAGELGRAKGAVSEEARQKGLGFVQPVLRLERALLRHNTQPAIRRGRATN